ncbi:MAG: YlxR family protein [Nocardioidaceae bacterium]|nr:YlxR family protein [Nocardioidaceae bacterium]
MTRSSPPSSGDQVRTQPIRTCVGCRKRASKPELIRIIAVGDGTMCRLTPDVRGAGGGRGAHLHPTVACLDLALRRKAFGRALRRQGSLDESAVRAYVRMAEDTTTTDRTTAPTGGVTEQKRSTRS